MRPSRPLTIPGQTLAADPALLPEIFSAASPRLPRRPKRAAHKKTGPKPVKEPGLDPAENGLQRYVEKHGFWTEKRRFQGAKTGTGHPPQRDATPRNDVRETPAETGALGGPKRVP